MASSVSSSPAIRSRCAASPSKSRFTSSYTSRALERVIVRSRLVCTTLPASSMSISALMVNLSSSGRSEHTPLESCSGSIGSTRPGKYTLVPRRYASRSSAEPCGT